MAFVDNLSGASAGLRRGVANYAELMRNAAEINNLISNDDYRQNREAMPAPTVPAASTPIAYPTPRPTPQPAAPAAGLTPSPYSMPIQPSYPTPAPAAPAAPASGPIQPSYPAMEAAPAGLLPAFTPGAPVGSVAREYNPDESALGSAVGTYMDTIAIRREVADIGGSIHLGKFGGQHFSTFLNRIVGTQGEQAAHDLASEAVEWYRRDDVHGYFVANPDLLEQAKADPVAFYAQVKDQQPADADADAEDDTVDPEDDVEDAAEPAAAAAGLTTAPVLKDAATGEVIPSVGDPAKPAKAAPAAEQDDPDDLLPRSALFEATNVPLEEYASLRQIKEDDRREQIDFYNQQLQESSQINSRQIALLTQKARAAQAAGAIGIMDQAMAEAAALIDANEATEATIRLEAKKYLADSDKDMLKLQLSEAAAQFVQLDDPSEINSAWSGLTGRHTEVVPVGDGTYQIGFVDKKGQPQWVGGAKPRRFTKDQILEQYQSIYDEAFRASTAAAASAAQLELQKHRQKIDEIMAESTGQINLEMVKAELDGDKVQSVTESFDGITVTLKNGDFILFRNTVPVDSNGVPGSRVEYVKRPTAVY